MPAWAYWLAAAIVLFVIIALLAWRVRPFSSSRSEVSEENEEDATGPETMTAPAEDASLVVDVGLDDEGAHGDEEETAEGAEGTDRHPEP